MKTLILCLIITSILQSCSTRNFTHNIQEGKWAKPLPAKNTSRHDLSSTNYILDENEVLLREIKTNSFPTDKESPFYWINKRTEKSKKLNPRPRAFNEIRKFDFYSKNRAD
jgi:hypothetical protein